MPKAVLSYDNTAALLNACSPATSFSATGDKSVGSGSLSPNIAATNHSGGSQGILGLNAAAVPSAPNEAQLVDNTGKRARVLYDYDAADKTELSLVADEVRLL